MWFTDNEKLDIGRRVYTQEISRDQASPIIREQEKTRPLHLAKF